MNFSYQNALVTIAAVKLQSVIDFYAQLLNQSPQTHIDNVYGEFQLQGLRLGIFRPKSRHQEEFSQSAGSGISICLEVDDLQEVINHLREMGYPPPGEVMSASHGQEIYAYDPAGNRLILHQGKI